MSKNSALILVLSVTALVSIGMVMLFSTGAYAHDAHGDAYFFIKRQGVFLGIGIVACVVAAIVDYHVWAKLWLPMFLAAVALLALCFVPHIGLKVHGSARWVHVGSFMFQPSEIGKFATVVALAWWFNRYEQRSTQLLHGFILPLMLIGVLMGLIVREEDLGATLLIGVTMITIMFVAGSNPIYMTSSLGLRNGWRNPGSWRTNMQRAHAGRLDAYSSTSKQHKDGKGLQQWEALKAFGSGGSFRSWPGRKPREDRLPALRAHGFHFSHHRRGTRSPRFTLLFVIFTFLSATLSGILIAMQARDRFGMLLGFGLSHQHRVASDR